jgi:hypothetical protein
VSKQGIILLAFGKKGYLRLAYNMAYSIRHFNPSLHITLVVTEGLKGIQSNDYSVFSHVDTIPESDHLNNGRIDPAKVKSKMYAIGSKYYDNFLYLDVDGIALCDPEPLLNYCIQSGAGYLTDVIGKGGKLDHVPYSMWATNQVIWDYFKLLENATLCGIQSSWAYFSKRDGKKLGEMVAIEYEKGFPEVLLSNKWGHTLPDELLFQGCCAKLGIDPTLIGFSKKPIFFGNVANHPITDILNNYVILSCFGNSGSKGLTKLHYLELYDRIMRDYCKSKGESHRYKVREYCMIDKHCNGRA